LNNKDIYSVKYNQDNQNNHNLYQIRKNNDIIKNWEFVIKIPLTLITNEISVWLNTI